MKIVKKYKAQVWPTVGVYNAGDVVAMKAPVNEYCKKDDLYIVGTIPCCYLRDAKGPGFTDWVLRDKIAVTNLRTGGVSLVQGSRPCQGRPNATVEDF